MNHVIDLANLNKVTMVDVLAPNFLLQSEDTYLAGVILVVKKFDRPLKTFKTATNKFKPPINESSYDRMIIIGEENSRTCFVIIADSAMKSGNLFRNEAVSVGSYVAVVEPIYSEHCLGNDPSNPIINTTYSLQQYAPVVQNLINLDINLNPSGTAMYHFTVRNIDLLFLQGQFVSPTCSGFLCDRRNIKNSTMCACVQKSSIPGWTIQARVIAEEDDLFGGVFFQSHAFAKLFCTPAILRQPVSSLVQRSLRDAILRVTTHVNNGGAWNVEGYVKSGVSEENIAQTVQQVRICTIVPNCHIPHNMKYDIRPFVEPQNPPPHLVPAPNAANQ